MLYGVLYNEGNTQMFHFYNNWEEAYMMMFHLNGSLWGLYTESPVVFVKMVEV